MNAYRQNNRNFNNTRQQQQAIAHKTSKTQATRPALRHINPQTGKVSLSKIIDSIVLNNKVVIFSKTVCPFCVKAKAFLDQLGVPYHSEELDKRPEGNDLHHRLIALTGQRTVPNIVVDGVSIGGYDTLVSLHNKGKLLPLLKKVGAI